MEMSAFFGEHFFYFNCFHFVQNINFALKKYNGYGYDFVFINERECKENKRMTYSFRNQTDYHWNAYLDAIDAVLERGMAAKEVVCSITTGFRSTPSLRTKPGLNPYHASVADVGYGFDAVQGTIKRMREGENFSLALEMLVFDLDTLTISEQQLSPNFELAVREAPLDMSYLVNLSRQLNRQIGQMIREANRLGQELLSDQWDEIHARIENVQAIPRL